MRYHGMWILCTFFLAACGQGPDSGLPYAELGKAIPGSAGVYSGQNCQDDFLEPNDASDELAPLPLGTTEGLSICGSDDGYFIDLEAGQTLEVEIRFSHQDGDLDMMMLSNIIGENSPLYEFSVSTTDNEWMMATAQESHRVRITIWGDPTDGVSDENEYTLVATVTDPDPSSRPCQADFLEPNDTFGECVPLPLGTTEGLTVCGNQSDYYFIDLEPGQTLELEIRFSHQDGDLDMWMSGENTPLYEYSVSSTDNEWMMATAEERVKVRVTIIGYLTDGINQDENVYTLVATVTGPETLPEECPDDWFEPNDDLDQATRIDNYMMGEWRNLTTCPDDPDWFYTDTSLHQLGHVLTAEVTGRLELYVSTPESGDSWYSGEYRSDTGATEVKFRVHEPGPVYFVVYGGDQGGHDYSMRVSEFMPEREPEDLGSICGDVHDGTYSLTEFGPRLYRIEVEECSSLPYRMYIHARLTLPQGVTYDLTLFDRDWHTVSDPFLTVGPGPQPDYEYAYHSFGGIAFHADSLVYYLKVSLFGAQATDNLDADWQLDIRGGPEGF